MWAPFWILTNSSLAMLEDFSKLNFRSGLLESSSKVCGIRSSFGDVRNEMRSEV